MGLISNSYFDRIYQHESCLLYTSKDADGNVTVIDGIVDPADQYELEEQIITDLYNIKDKESGKRIIAWALRNRDAIALGLGGPDSGDIIYCCLLYTSRCV